MSGKNEIPPDRKVALTQRGKTNVLVAGYTRKTYRFLLANGEVQDVDAIRDDSDLRAAVVEHTGQSIAGCVQVKP